MPQTFVPSLAVEIIRSLADSDPFITNTNDSLSSLNRLAQQMPTKHRWRFRTVAAFNENLQRLVDEGQGTPAALNRHYWLDVFESFEAFNLMSIWRTVELVRSAVWAANRQDFLCAAIVTRSALETSVQFLDVARSVSATIEKMFKEADFTNTFIVSNELEAYRAKTILANRTPSALDEYRPTNIVTIIDRIAKIHGQADVKRHYEVLCEIAHPNFMGRWQYVTGRIAGERPGDEIWEIGPGRPAVNVGHLVPTTVWALSWSAAVQCSASDLLSTTLKHGFAALP
jgi:hypothetical protein